MKLFRQLLVAPAALGLLAPVAATAAELNIQDVSTYSRPSKKAKKRVKSISQFSDVYPTDWAFKALSETLKRHNCAPISTRGSMTRYEAAAILNECMSDVAQATPEERRLLNEFSSELAVIKGRVDGVEAGIGGTGGPGFSTTTRMNGSTIFVIGGIEGGDSSTSEAMSFNYKSAFDLSTSFSGEDFLTAEIESGNFVSTDPFGCSGGAALESCASSSNALELSRIYYTTPATIYGEDVTIYVGGLIRQDDMLAVWPSAYPTDSVLDVLTYAGANGAYNLASGAGAGINWTRGKWTTSLTWIGETSGDDSDGTAQNAASADDGIFTEEGDDNVTAQLAYIGDKGLTLAFAITDADGGSPGKADTDDYTALGLSGIYEIQDGDVESRLWPNSISAGIGHKWHGHDSHSGDTSDDYILDEMTFSFGFIWNDVGVEGNTLGIAMGTAEGWKDIDSPTMTNGDTYDDNYDYPMAYEIYYNMVISDSITVTPALFAVEKDNADNLKGALVKTTFSF